ncbi:hypothetical protein C8R47DRAFT_1107166 [Mycena vitilis]|nr:hypothetical protein C8R47DRAFT_1107166 [Mycena vitilis]
MTAQTQGSFERAAARGTAVSAPQQDPAPTNIPAPAPPAASASASTSADAAGAKRRPGRPKKSAGDAAAAASTSVQRTTSVASVAEAPRHGTIAWGMKRLDDARAEMSAFHDQLVDRVDDATTSADSCRHQIDTLVAQIERMEGTVRGFTRELQSLCARQAANVGVAARVLLRSAPVPHASPMARAAMRARHLFVERLTLSLSSSASPTLVLRTPTRRALLRRPLRPPRTVHLVVADSALSHPPLFSPRLSHLPQLPSCRALLDGGRPRSAPLSLLLLSSPNLLLVLGHRSTARAQRDVTTSSFATLLRAGAIRAGVAEISGVGAGVKERAVLVTPTWLPLSTWRGLMSWWGRSSGGHAPVMSLSSSAGVSRGRTAVLRHGFRCGVCPRAGGGNGNCVEPVVPDVKGARQYRGISGGLTGWGARGPRWHSRRFYSFFFISRSLYIRRLAVLFSFYDYPFSYSESGFSCT